MAITGVARGLNPRKRKINKCKSQHGTLQSHMGRFNHCQLPFDAMLGTDQLCKSDVSHMMGIFILLGSPHHPCFQGVCFSKHNEIDLSMACVRFSEFQ